MKDFSQLEVGSKLVMAYHDGNADVRDMGKSICFEELIIKDSIVAGHRMQIDARNRNMSRCFYAYSYEYFTIGIDCVVLPYDEEVMKLVQKLLYEGVMMRNKAINQKVRGFFRSLEFRLQTDSAGYIDF